MRSDLKMLVLAHFFSDNSQEPPENADNRSKIDAWGLSGPALPRLPCMSWGWVKVGVPEHWLLPHTSCTLNPQLLSSKPSQDRPLST